MRPTFFRSRLSLTRTRSPRGLMDRTVAAASALMVLSFTTIYLVVDDRLGLRPSTITIWKELPDALCFAPLNCFPGGNYELELLDVERHRIGSEIVHVDVPATS